MADGQVIFEINGDASNINQTVKQVTSNIDQESKKWDQAVGDSTESAGKSFLNWKTVALGAVAAIGSAVVKFGSEAIEAASDLQEVQNVVDTVFGDSASQIEAWAKKAGTQFGLTETMAKRFTSTLGAMAKSSGMAGDDILKMSTDLSGLAADMASFYNLDFETAFDKIRAGLSGQTMPLKQLGINMSEANLEAFALAQGLEKTYAEMDQGEQTMLRYQYMMQATSDAQGDFSKTADGFANSQRRIQTAFDTIKTSAGSLLMDAIGPLVTNLADFLEKLTTPVERTVLDDFNDINIDTADKMAELERTYEKAQAIVALLEEIGQTTVTLNDGTVTSYEELFKNLGNIEANGGDVTGYLESLGLDVDAVIQKYNVWKESTRQLTSLVPGLSSVIDSETYSIEGGTAALQENLDEWRQMQEKKIAWAAYYAKKQAIEEKKASMYAYEFDAGAARKAAELQRAKMEELYGSVFSENGGLWERVSVENKYRYETDSQFYNEANDAAEQYLVLLQKQREAEAELARQTVDYSEAEEELELGKQALIEKWGDEEQAIDDTTDAVEEYQGKSASAWAESTSGAQAAADAIKAVTDYYKAMRDSTAQAVNSTVKGFEEITSEYDELISKQDELSASFGEAETKYASLLSRYGGFEGIRAMNEEAWKKLPPEVQNAYNELAKLRNEQEEVNKALLAYDPVNMEKNLQSQIEWMDKYLENLQQLKEWGVSDEMIAFLSDGSKESAAYLEAIVGGGEDQARKLGEKYDEVAEKKNTFTDALTQNKLAVDETYQDLVDTMSAMMDAVDFGEEAYNAAAEDVVMIAQGIADNIPAVSKEVNSLLEALGPLSSIGYNWGYADGQFVFEWPDWPGHANGLDYVPFDNYPAFLHEGEAVLTAEENRLWQMFRNGHQPGMDYDALGGVMRDNVQAGGNVYLDGRTVGHVISDIQGNQYRSLQRSGWQG